MTRFKITCTFQEAMQVLFNLSPYMAGRALTRYRLDSPGFETRWGQKILSSLKSGHTGLGSHPASSKGYRGFSLA